MGAITDKAKAMVDELEAADVDATSDVRQVSLPGVLVVPVPSYDFTEGTLAGGVELTWVLWAIVRSPGDLAAAEKLEELVQKCAETFDILTAEAAAYKLPGSTKPFPAYKLTTTEIT
jgi:hypothetical protein